MFLPTKADVKLANGIMGNSQVIGIILYHYPNWPNIYPVGTVYYCPGYPSNTTSSGALKCYVIFQKFTYEPLGNCDFVEPQGHSWISLNQNRNNLDYI